MQHKKICTLEAIDVYCFGHVLYEMAIGSPLHESYIVDEILDCPPPISKYCFCVAVISLLLSQFFWFLSLVLFCFFIYELFYSVKELNSGERNIVSQKKGINTV